jgi:hypothetical protein
VARGLCRIFLIQCRCCRGLLQTMSTFTLLDELHIRAVSVIKLEFALDWVVATYLRCMKQTTVRETRKLKDHRRTKSKIQLQGHLKGLEGMSRDCTRLCFLQAYGPLFVICVSLVNTYMLRTHCPAFEHTEGAVGMQEGRRWNETCFRARLDRCHRCIGVARMRTLA